MDGGRRVWEDIREDRGTCRELFKIWKDGVLGGGKSLAQPNVTADVTLAREKDGASRRHRICVRIKETGRGHLGIWSKSKPYPARDICAWAGKSIICASQFVRERHEMSEMRFRTTHLN